MKIASSIARWIVAVSFLLSGLIHLGNPFAYFDQVLQYEVLPLGLARAVAVGFPWLLMVTGMALLVEPTARPASRLAILVLLLFGVAQAIVLIRGKEIECGCFGYGGETISIFTVSRTVLLGACAGLGGLHAPSNQRSSPTHEPVVGSLGKRPLGLSMVELLVAITITSLLAAISIVGISRAREAARQTECKNKLKQLSLAAVNYESSRRHLPPGTLGFKEVVPWEEHRNEASSHVYWKRAPYTSSFALILPYLEGDLNAEYPSWALSIDAWVLDQHGRPAHQEGYTWFGDFLGFDRAAKQRFGQLRCPSDTEPANPEYIFAAIQPVSKPSVSQQLTGWVNLAEHQQTSSMTHYLGCLGAHSGGIWENAMNPHSREYPKFRGLMGVRRPTSLQSVKDGMSSTVMYGETLGSIDEGVRDGYQSWLVGGVARGIGNNQFLESPTMPIFGDSHDASWLGFGSAHPGGVFAAYGDGHVELTHRGIDWRIWTSACGIADASSLP